MGTGDRKKSGNLFTGSRLVVDGQGNSGVLRNKSNGFNNIFKTSNDGPGPALTPTQTPTDTPTTTEIFFSACCDNLIGNFIFK